MDSLNNEGALWAVRVVFSCLVAGAVMIRTQEYCFLECKNQIKEVGVGINSGLVGWLFGLHMKCILTGIS